MQKAKTRKKKRQYKKLFCNVDWTTLQRGDKIKVIGCNGPNMQVDGKTYYTGTPSGVYIVHKVDSTGIHAYQGINHFFIYMGPEKESLLGQLAPHKFKKYL